MSTTFNEKFCEYFKALEADYKTQVLAGASNLVFDKTAQELIGRALTEEEYNNITQQELLDAISHSSLGWCVVDTVAGGFSPYAHNTLMNKTTTELKQFIDENGGMLIRSEEPMFRNEFPLITKGSRKGHPNFNKEPEEFGDRISLSGRMNASQEELSFNSQQCSGGINPT
jgi:hypothetical protein